MENVTWFTRYGTGYTGSLRNIDLKKGTAEYSEARDCSRCGGDGSSDKWKFTGLTCYDCGGSGKHKNGPATRKVYTAEKLAKLNVTQEKATAKRVEAAKVKKAERDAMEAVERENRRAEADAWKADHQDIIDGIRRYSGNEEEGTDNFFNKMGDAVWKYGKLSERQLDVTRSAIAREDAKRATKYVGECGTRIEMTLQVEKVIPLGERGMYGQRYLHLCRDEQGNRIVYKGTGYSIPGEGHTCRVKATVDGHDCYRGEKQTFISRPKRLDEVTA